MVSVGIVTLTLGLMMARTADAGVVISQVYGGGGNSGAPFTNDFIELFNNGSTPQSLAGWSVQYASATGTGNFGFNAGELTPLSSVTLQAGQYFLIQEASNAAVGAPLPTPDLTDTIAMSATGAKVALVNGVASLGCNGGSTPCTPAQLALIIDLVGYGGANFWEGTNPAPTLSNTTADFRTGGGCTDTNNNGAEFFAAGPAPRNTASPLNVCSVAQAPEPATLAILGLGLAGLGVMRRRRAA